MVATRVALELASLKFAMCSKVLQAPAAVVQVLGQIMDAVSPWPRPGSLRT